MKESKNDIDNWYPQTKEDWKVVHGQHWLAYGVGFDNASQSAVRKALSIKKAARIVLAAPITKEIEG